MRPNKIYFHFSVFHRPELILVMKKMDLIVNVFFLHYMFWEPKILLIFIFDKVNTFCFWILKSGLYLF